MFGAGLPTGGHRRVRPGRITALRACGCRTVELFPFSGRGAGLRFCSLWPHSSRKWWGFPKGAVPLWHTTFGTQWKKSSVLYLLSRLARERGWTAGQPLCSARKASGGMERQQPFLRLLSGGTKGIYSPRPPSIVPPQRNQRNNLRRKSSSAARSVFCARFSVRWKCAAVFGMGCSSPSVKP